MTDQTINNPQFRVIFIGKIFLFFIFQLMNSICGSKLLTFQKTNSSSQQKIKQPIVAPLQAEHIEEASHLLVKAFMSMNPLYQNMNLDYDKLLAFMRNKCEKALTEVLKYNNYGMSWVLLLDGKVVAVITNYELTNYVKTLKKANTGIQSLDSYLNANLQFWKSVDISQYKEGEAIYGDYVGVLQEDANKGYGLLITDIVYRQGVDKLKYFISRISNPKFRGLLTKHRHAKVLKEINFTFHGVTHPFWMLEVPFQKIRNQQLANTKSKL